MKSPGSRLADAALSLVGTPYRLHCHDPRQGLDCVGLLIASLALMGRSLEVPMSYQLRNREIAHFLALADRGDFMAVSGQPQPGDILLVQPGPAQHHILIAVGPERFVHAHASLRRVVILPGPSPWPILRRWRLLSSES